MGFFGLFGKKRLNSADITIDITNHIATINGKAIKVPCQLSELTAIFGKPRYFRGGAINYTWDDLGIYCYVTERNLVYCLAIQDARNAEPIAIEPKENFEGVLTIGGTPWEEVMAGGEDLEIARSRDYDGLELFSTYSDFDSRDMYGTNHAYLSIEIKFI